MIEQKDIKQPFPGAQYDPYQEHIESNCKWCYRRKIGPEGTIYPCGVKYAIDQPVEEIEQLARVIIPCITILKLLSCKS